MLVLGGLRLAGQSPAFERDVAWELKVVQPRETSSARYAHVAEEEISRLSAQGWQLVSPYVLLNEERGLEGREQIVTQTYPAYYLQRPRASEIEWEVKAVFPREISPARYAQVPEVELRRLAADGWRLVSVAPYVLLNEERGPEGRKLAVTQTYPAYFFQRQKPRRSPR